MKRLYYSKIIRMKHKFMFHKFSKNKFIPSNFYEIYKSYILQNKFFLFKFTPKSSQFNILFSKIRILLSKRISLFLYDYVFFKSQWAALFNKILFTKYIGLLFNDSFKKKILKKKKKKIKKNLKKEKIFLNSRNYLFYSNQSIFQKYTRCYLNNQINFFLITKRKIVQVINI